MAVDSSDEDKKPATPKRRPKILAPPKDLFQTPPAKRRKRGDISFDSFTLRQNDNAGSIRQFSLSNNTSNELKAAERIKALDGSFLSCFFTRVYIFSNHFWRRNGLVEIDGNLVDSEFQVESVKYMCVEQYYMFYKARVFGDMSTARQIMNAPDARTMKKLGSSIVGFNLEKWRRVSLIVMVIASLRKYEQNADLRQLLLDTGDTTIVETNPGDNYWGVGLFMHDPLLRNTKSWRGKNILGRILMKVRQILLQRKEFQPSSVKTEKKLSRKSSMSQTPIRGELKSPIKKTEDKVINKLELKKSNKALKRKVKLEVTMICQSNIIGCLK